MRFKRKRTRPCPPRTSTINYIATIIIGGSVLVLCLVLLQPFVTIQVSEDESHLLTSDPILRKEIRNILKQQNLSSSCFVCITGQFQRLELADKVRHLLHPLLRAGIRPDIALVLTDTNQTHFTNPHYQNQHLQQKQQQKQIYDSYQQASDYLTKQGFTVLSTAPFHQSNNPHVPLDYINHMDKKEFTKEQQLHRCQNHVRQYQSLHQCGVLYNATNGNNNGNNNGKKYAFVLRLRDDLGFHPQMWKGSTTYLLSILKELYQYQHEYQQQHAHHAHTILSNDCKTHGGMNDRLAWVSPEAAHQYFQLPLQVMTQQPQAVFSPTVHNPESFLLSTYLSNHLTVIVTPKLRGLIKWNMHDNNQTRAHMVAVKEPLSCPEEEMPWYFYDPTLYFPWLKGRASKRPLWLKVILWMEHGIYSIKRKWHNTVLLLCQ